MTKRDTQEFRFEVIPLDDGDEIIIIRQPGHSLNLNLAQAKVISDWLQRHLTSRAADLRQQAQSEDEGESGASR